MNPFDAGWARHQKSSGTGHASQRHKPGDASAEADARFAPCHILAPDLVAYFDSEADTEAALRARRHLDSCPECARMWRDWGDSRLLMRTQRLPEMPSEWPGALVQKARLHALLPSLFATPSLADDLPAEAEEVAGPRPPRDLHEAILSRTTRSLDHSAAEALRASSLELPQSRGGASRRKAIARACVPVLAAWMIVLASMPKPAPEETRDSSAGNVLLSLRDTAVATSDDPLRSPSPDEPLELMGAVLRASPASPAPSSPASQEPAAQQASSTSRPRPAESAAPKSPPRLASAPTILTVREPSSAATRVATQRDEKAPAVATRPLSQRSSSGSTPRAAVRIAASASEPRAVPEAPKAQPSRTSSATPRAAGQGASRADEHETMSAVLALNDTRPAEIGSAIDDYASTWIDDGEA